jgi:hypothetical protein
MYGPTRSDEETQMAPEDAEKLSDATHEADRRDARVRAHADREPTPEEEAAADAAGPSDPEVAAHEREMTERGARQKGEGRIP